MLTELNIKNFAIIDRLKAEFGPGLQALTGETGAGKSILIDAISLLLGGRASPEMIRTGEEEASVEAFFDLGEEEEKKILDPLGLDCSGGLMIRRLVTRSGRSRAWINGSPVALHMMERLGTELIHIYGQHEHQQFLDPLRHIDILDRCAGLLPPREDFQEKYRAWQEAHLDLREKITKREQRGSRMELLTFQSQEIARAKLKTPVQGEPDEEEVLSAERMRLSNAEKLHALSHEGFEMLYGEGGSAVERLKGALQRLREGGKFDPALIPFSSGLESALFQTEDVAASLRSYRDSVQFDPGRLEMIESRLDEIRKLKRKYGASIAEILAYKEKIDQERKTLDNLEEEISAGEKKSAELHRQAKEAAAFLSGRREGTARELAGKMEAELSVLGMKKVRFAIQVAKLPGEGSPALNETGMDRVEFLFSPNPGEELKPLAKIASGGELSRTMLAFKRIFAEESAVKTLIFDEVDAGIGGGVAEIVGRKLKEISRQHQVFCITHLPQIASLADVHYRIAKRIAGGRTMVELRRLAERDREDEVARMLGGIQITEKTLAHAREMIKNAKRK